MRWAVNPVISECDKRQNTVRTLLFLKYFKALLIIIFLLSKSPQFLSCVAYYNTIKENNDVFGPNKMKNTQSKVSLKQKSIFCKSSKQPHLVLSDRVSLLWCIRNNSTALLMYMKSISVIRFPAKPGSSTM